MRRNFRTKMLTMTNLSTLYLIHHTQLLHSFPTRRSSDLFLHRRDSEAKEGKLQRSTPPPDLPFGRAASIRTCSVSRKPSRLYCRTTFTGLLQAHAGSLRLLAMRMKTEQPQMYRRESIVSKTCRSRLCGLPKGVSIIAVGIGW